MEEAQVNLRLEEKLAIIDLKGDVTGFAEKRIVSAFEKATAQNVKCIIFNFSAVGYINSAGMSIFIALLTRSQSRPAGTGLKLRVFGLSEHFQKIFDMVGLLKYMPYFSSELEARASCS